MQMPWERSLWRALARGAKIAEHVTMFELMSQKDPKDTRGLNPYQSLGSILNHYDSILSKQMDVLWHITNLVSSEETDEEERSETRVEMMRSYNELLKVYLEYQRFKLRLAGSKDKQDE